MAARPLRMISSIRQELLPAGPSKRLDKFFPRMLQSCQSLLYAHSHQHRNLKPPASLPAFQPVRAFASSTVSRQLENTHTPTNKAIQKSRSDTTNINDRQDPTTTEEEDDAAAIPATDAHSAIAAIRSITQETSLIKETLHDPDIQLTPEARAKKLTRLRELDQQYKIWGAKAAWWHSVYETEPKEMTTVSDVYERVK
ncbi:MAG: hypothetical protein Q9168_002217, partial [Polycauliona sp. 1 TL-2023]